MRAFEDVAHRLREARRLKLTHGDVVRESSHLDAGTPPVMVLAADFAQDAIADRDDEARVFRDANEPVRRHHAEARMAPPAQGLDAHDRSGAQIDTGLINDGQLIARERLTELALELDALHRFAIHRFFVVRKAPGAGRFRAIHCNVRVAQQHIDRDAVLGIHRDADRGGHEMFDVAEQHGPH